MFESFHCVVTTFSLALTIMPSDRIAFLRGKLADDHPILVSILPNVASGKVKVKILVRPNSQRLTDIVKVSIGAVLDTLAQLVADRCVVDRGHMHTDGTHEICLWINDYVRILVPRPSQEGLLAEKDDMLLGSGGISAFSTAQGGLSDVRVGLPLVRLGSVQRSLSPGVPSQVVSQRCSRTIRCGNSVRVSSPGSSLAGLCGSVRSILGGYILVRIDGRDHNLRLDEVELVQPQAG